MLIDVLAGTKSSACSAGDARGIHGWPAVNPSTAGHTPATAPTFQAAPPSRRWKTAGAMPAPRAAWVRGPLAATPSAEGLRWNCTGRGRTVERATDRRTVCRDDTPPPSKGNHLHPLRLFGTCFGSDRPSACRGLRSGGNQDSPSEHASRIPQVSDSMHRGAAALHPLAFTEGTYYVHPSAVATPHLPIRNNSGSEVPHQHRRELGGGGGSCPSLTAQMLAS